MASRGASPVAFAGPAEAAGPSNITKDGALITPVIRDAQGKIAMMSPQQAADYCEDLVPDRSHLISLEELSNAMNPDGVRKFSQDLKVKLQDDYSIKGFAPIQKQIDAETAKNRADGFILYDATSGSEETFFYNPASYNSSNDVASAFRVDGLTAAQSRLVLSYDGRKIAGTDGSGKQQVATFFSAVDGRVSFQRYTFADLAKRPRGAVRCVVSGR